jgi:membrane associated rhomboid family serine protease
MFGHIAPITRTLIIANVAVFGLQYVWDLTLTYHFALWPWHSVASPISAPFQFWQVVTYGFMHGSPMHLFVNMFALFMFGSEIERSMGVNKYLTYYFACVVGAALAQLAVGAITQGPLIPTVGASGAVFGLLLAFGIAYPHRRIMLLFPPIPMPAWLFVTLYGLMELYLGVFGTRQGIAHFAHLGGMAAGYLLILYWRHGRR